MAMHQITGWPIYPGELMEDRLTGRNEYGGIIPIIEGVHGAVIMNRIVRKLSAYEDAAPLSKVQEWAKVKQDDRLVVLPCKAWDKLYYVNKVYRMVRPVKAITFKYDFRGLSEIGLWGGDYTPVLAKPEDIGVTIFYTHEAADAALKEGTS